MVNGEWSMVSSEWDIRQSRHAEATYHDFDTSFDNSDGAFVASQSVHRFVILFGVKGIIAIISRNRISNDKGNSYGSHRYDR